MTLRPLCLAMLALAGAAGASSALALGFGRVPESVVLGQALDLTVPVRLDPGETLAPGCLQAEVHVGDHRLPPGAVQLALETPGGEPRVRIRSNTVVLEPLVAVNLSLGCGNAVSRQFVVFADPADSPAGPASPPVPAAVAAVAPVADPPPARVAPAAKAAPRKPARTAQPGFTRTASSTPARRTPRRDVVAAKTGTPRTAAPVPRLKLEEPDELLKAAAATVAAQDAALAVAAQAASAAQAAASSAEQRLAQMEANLKQLRDDAAAQRTAMEQLRNRLAQADEQARWQPLLMALLGVLALAVLALGWRLRALQRERQAAWWQGAAPALVPAADAAEASSSYEPPPPDTVPPRDLQPAPVAPMDETSPAMQRTAPLPPQALDDDPLSRPVSVDELIDLEQQAEFFVVLGEEDAAVDLLMAHLRSTGGTSPLPYLKLLEIFRRRGDREAYERMRRRFGQRFNAVAPEWEADPDKGRDLLDYPDVLATLQAQWPQPLDAMAELENLLFRRRSGEMFDLPAYRDVLALFSVARELNRQVEVPGTDVDVLLPLGDGADGRAGPPSIFDSDFSDGAELRPLEDRPTAPVDLDLSEPAMPADSRPGALPPVRATLRLD